MASKDGLKKWQVFTPNVIVKKILTTVHYNNYQILGYWKIHVVKDIF
mgnify:CR=1 FL=1